MSVTVAPLAENAFKSFDMLHRILGVWLILCIVAAFLPATPQSAQLKLPFTEINIPSDSARWACMVVIFLSGVACCAVLRHIREICVQLSSTEYLAVVISYPSIATIGTPFFRMFSGYALTTVQYFVGYQFFAPMPHFLPGSQSSGLAFLYACSMLWFTYDLRDWQRGKCSTSTFLTAKSESLPEKA